MRRTIPKALALLVSASVLGIGVTASPAAGSDIDAATRVRVTADYGKLPMSFEANQGQADPSVQFLARGSGYGLFLTPTEAVLSLPGVTASAQSNAVIRMRLAGANPQPQVVGLELLPGTSNYFIGDDPTKWHSAIPNYAKVKYAAVYPGIDLVYYGKQRQLEYDFIVAPGADPKCIVLEFKGAKELALDADGNLVLTTAGQELVQHRPVVYQEIDGARRIVGGGYKLRGKNRASFEIARYDASRPLIIDPTLVTLLYSTYLGGPSADYVSAIAVDGSGKAYVTGYTIGTFPTTPGAYQPMIPGPVGSAYVFVTKLNATGTALEYSTYLGPGVGNGIAVDASGCAYITGAASGGFPTTLGAYQTSFGGLSDGFVTKLNPSGSALVYSTYLGGPDYDQGNAVAVDASGNAYVTGQARDFFPTTPGAFQATGFGVIVAKLNATGSALAYSTYVGNGGSGTRMAVDGSGNAYVTGYTYDGGFPTTPGGDQTTFGGGTDAFLTKLNAAGSALVYSTYLGGKQDDYAYGIALDAGGNAYLTGYTYGNFPTTPGAYQTASDGSSADAFVTKLNATGSALVYSTYLGGSGSDQAFAIAVDAAGNAQVTGNTHDFMLPDYAFVRKLDSTGSALVYAVDFVLDFRGAYASIGFGIALDGSGNAYVTGVSDIGFPTTPGAYQTSSAGGGDAFVTKISAALPSARLMVPDGTSLQQRFSSYPEIRWFAMTVEPGKTYVVDTVDVDGDLGANAVGTLGIYAVDGVLQPPETNVDCSSGNGQRPPAVDVASNGLRCVIRTFPPDGTVLNQRPVYVKVAAMDPAAGGGSQFRIRAREATVYGRWLTAGYDYHVEIENTTGDPMCVEVCRYASLGLVHVPGYGWQGPMDSFTMTVPPFGAKKHVVPAGSLVGGYGDGPMRISACASPTNLVPGALHVSTYAVDPVSGRFIHFFPSTANEGKTRST